MSMSDSAEMAREPLDKVDEELQTVASLVRLSIKNQQQHQQLQRHGWGDSHKVQDAAGAFDCSGDAERRFQVRVVLCSLLC